MLYGKRKRNQFEGHDGNVFIIKQGQGNYFSKVKLKISHLIFKYSESSLRIRRVSRVDKTAKYIFWFKVFIKLEK